MRSTEDLKHGFMLCQGGNAAWPVMFVTDTWCSMVGISLDKAVHQSLWDIFEVDPWSKVQPPLAPLAPSPVHAGPMKPASAFLPQLSDG